VWCGEVSVSVGSAKGRLLVIAVSNSVGMVRDVSVAHRMCLM
jgi:hypothetical protein